MLLIDLFFIAVLLNSIHISWSAVAINCSYCCSDENVTKIEWFLDTKRWQLVKSTCLRLDL